MTSGELEGKIVSENFWPSCSNCELFSECSARPKHQAYPTRWRWSRLASILPEGVLVLSSWVRGYAVGSSDSGCTSYRVDPKHYLPPTANHREYAKIELRRRTLVEAINRVAGQGPGDTDVEIVMLEVEEIERRQRSLLDE